MIFTIYDPSCQTLLINLNLWTLICHYISLNLHRGVWIIVTLHCATPVVVEDLSELQPLESSRLQLILPLKSFSELSCYPWVFLHVLAKFLIFEAAMNIISRSHNCEWAPKKALHITGSFTNDRFLHWL